MTGGRIKFTGAKNTRNFGRSAKRRLAEDETLYAVVNYLKYKYPKALVKTDYWAGMKQSYAQAAKAKKLGALKKSYPDIFIAEPNNGYHGLFIELKRDEFKIYKRDGEMVANKHIREQAEMLKQLNERGYKAVFACGLTEAMAAIDDYMSHP